MTRSLLLVLLFSCGGPREGADCREFLSGGPNAVINCDNPSAPLMCCSLTAPCGNDTPREVWVRCSSSSCCP
jgi:hypothetical protein